jgi:hypothetical protein
MFWSNPSLDLKITLFLMAFVFFVSLLVLAKKKKWLPAVLTFSLLGNLICFMSMGVFTYYGASFISYFTFYIWPIINILLIIYYAQKKR